MAASWLHADKLTAEQRSNVATIIAVGKRLGASQRDITIALMTAAQESEFRNINYGDKAGPDSRGLFQQRAPWGTLAQRMNPASAAAMFFQGGHGGQRGLFDFKNRDQLSLTRAAQAVQVSAFPDAYAKHESLARTLLGSAPAASPGARAADVLHAAASERTPAAEAAGLAASRAKSVAAAPAVPTPGLDPSLTAVPGVTAAPAASLPVPGTPVVQAAPATDALAPGAEASVAPGAEAAVAPGAQGSTTPGADATTHFPTVNEATFHSLFPDAAGTSMFTGQVGGASNGRRSDLVSNALSYLGTPYVWGGNGRSGVDCSGLVQQVYKSMGIDLPRLSADQARSGTKTSLSRLSPGDLVAMDDNGRNNGADHIAIYAGNGYIVEAPRPGLNVRKRKIGPNETGWYGVHFAALG